MTTPSKSKSRFEQLLSEIYARPICEKPRSRKKKKRFCTKFYVLDYQNYSFEILSSL